MTRGAMDFFPKAVRARSWVIPNPVEQRSGRQIADRKPNTVTAVGQLTHPKDLICSLMLSRRLPVVSRLEVGHLG